MCSGADSSQPGASGAGGLNPKRSQKWETSPGVFVGHALPHLQQWSAHFFPSRPFATPTLVGNLSERPLCLPKTHGPWVLLNCLFHPPTLLTSTTAQSSHDIRFKEAMMLFTWLSRQHTQPDPSLVRPSDTRCCPQRSACAGYSESIFSLATIWCILFSSS